MTILARAILSTYRGEKRFSASFRRAWAGSVGFRVAYLVTLNFEIKVNGWLILVANIFLNLKSKPYKRFSYRREGFASQLLWDIYVAELRIEFCVQIKLWVIN